ncbi:hypothetical protein EDD85DRAFT_960974 [Armillaria nabsnona]|nr:hypothetical protein EDD85DRAFT_960974 [Armillaria nabsnona]
MAELVHTLLPGGAVIKRGHKVIVITHSHSLNRVGIRWLLPSPKVYHLPFVSIASSAMFFTFLPYLRMILIQEHIHLIHAHASLSSLGHEGILHSHLLGVETVFTDHSFEDAASILTNKLLAGTLRNVDAVICVSHTGRENTVPRGELFDKSGRVRDNSSDTMTIVVFSRLAYRKGIDLVATAPRICSAFPNIRFVVVIDLLQMREKHNLQDRIELLGSIRPNAVRSVLMRGAIFFNTSLTESFGIAILEAAFAGLGQPLLATSHSFPFLPLLRSRSTLDLNMDGRNTLVDHEVTDYAQGTLAGTRGGSPVHADVSWSLMDSLILSRCQREPVSRPFGSASFHLLKTQVLNAILSVFGPASDDNEWGIDLKWLKWLPLSFKLGNDATNHDESATFLIFLSDPAMLYAGYRGTMGVDLFARIDDRAFAGERTGISQAGAS